MLDPNSLCYLDSLYSFSNHNCFIILFLKCWFVKNLQFYLISLWDWNDQSSKADLQRCVVISPCNLPNFALQPSPILKTGKCEWILPARCYSSHTAYPCSAFQSAHSLFRHFMTCLSHSSSPNSRLQYVFAPVLLYSCFSSSKLWLVLAVDHLHRSAADTLLIYHWHSKNVCVHVHPPTYIIYVQYTFLSIFFYSLQIFE